jgi:hypothetical protein
MASRVRITVWRSRTRICFSGTDILSLFQKLGQCVTEAQMCVLRQKFLSSLKVHGSAALSFKVMQKPTCVILWLIGFPVKRALIAAKTMWARVRTLEPSQYDPAHLNSRC